MEKHHIVNIRKEMDSALKEIGVKYGLSIAIGTIKHSHIGFSTKIEGTLCDAGNAIPKSEADFPFYCEQYGFLKSDLKRKFKVNGKIFELCGIKPRNTKYPLIGKNLANGKNYKFTPEQVYRGFKSDYGMNSSINMKIGDGV